jgi:signal peptidase II
MPSTHSKNQVKSSSLCKALFKMPRGKGKIIIPAPLEAARRRRPLVLTGLISLSVFFVDQLTKILAIKLFHPEKSFSLIPGILSFSLVKNTGAAFGILRNLTFIFILAAFFVIGYIFYLIIRKRNFNANPVLLGLFLGGTIGNLVDRIRFGYVIDFIDFHIWPVFNIADSAITISLCWFLILALKDKNVSNPV